MNSLMFKMTSRRVKARTEHLVLLKTFQVKLFPIMHKSFKIGMTKLQHVPRVTQAAAVWHMADGASSRNQSSS